MILGLVAIDVRELVFWWMCTRDFLKGKIEKYSGKLARATSAGDDGDIERYTAKVAKFQEQLDALGEEKMEPYEVVEAASVGIIPSGAVTEEGGHVEVEAPPGRLGLRFETGTGHLVISVAPTSALAGRVSVGDRLVSIRAPGREFYCGSLRTGSDIVAEFRATAGTKRVLTFVRVVGNVVQGRGPRVDSS